MNVGVIFDAESKSGGGFFQSLSSAIMLNKINDSRFNFIFIVFSTEVEKELQSKGLKTINFKDSFIFNAYKKIYDIKIFSKFFKKFKYKNTFFKFLIKSKINFLIFLGPSSLINFLENINFSYTILDVHYKIHSFFPEYRGKDYYLDREKVLQEAVDKSFKVLVDTNTTKQDVSFYYKCKPEKIIVQPFVPYLPKTIDEKKNYQLNADIKKRINLQENQKYFFYPAQFWAHKNHKYIIDFLNLLKNENKKNYKVVCCGSNKKNRSYVEKLIKENTLENDFIIFNYLSDEEVIQLYKNSFGLIMPTYVARSTLPLYESFYFRKPVFYSNDILDDKLYQFVIGFDSTNPNDLLNKLKSIENGEIDLEKKVNLAYQYYKEVCSEEYFVKNYQKIINEYDYLRKRWEK